jgi:two-component system, chemotaxis family, response regulator Rcp1
MAVEVLLVEDNPGDVVMMKEALREARLDYRLHHVSDGQDALGYLDRPHSEASPCLDLIILDLNLPRVDGRELFRRFREWPGLQGIPIVILTTSSWDQEAGALDGLTREAYFEKPSMIDDWVTVVQAIDAYRQGQKGRRQEG